jgi:hypothetical protein
VMDYVREASGSRTRRQSDEIGQAAADDAGTVDPRLQPAKTMGHNAKQRAESTQHDSQ